MMIEVTDWAKDILTRSHEAARRFNPDTVIRLTRTGSGIETILAEAPAPDDKPVAVGEVTLYVEQGLDGVVDIEEPHDRIVLKPPGSEPNVRPEH